MNSSKRSGTVVTALALIAFSGFCAGGNDTYYRWVDVSGTLVNSDRPPPPGVEFDVITTNTNQMMDGRTTSADVTQEATASPNTASAQQNEPASQMVLEKNPEACAAAQKNLETLNTHARVRIPDGNGNFRFLNEEEKVKQIAHAEAAISQYCE